jgi:lysophospholipase
VYNPFDYFVNGKYSFGVATDPNGPILRLNDGGMDFQNIPVAPLLYRDVDIIVAVDNSGDTPSNWPNGTALYTSMQWAQARNIPFPIVPSPTQLVQSGNNTKPRFFGCNSNTGPLIVYLPAAAVVNGANGVVNIGTVSFSVEAKAVPVMIANGQANALRPAGTPGANDVPSNWAQCVGCAVMARQLARASVPLPSVCRTCFNQLCYS